MQNAECRIAGQSRPKLRQSDPETIRQANPAVVGDHALEAEAVADKIAPGPAHLSEQSGLRRQLDEGGGQGLRVAARNETARPAIEDLFRRATCVCGNHRQARRHGLEGSVGAARRLGDHDKRIQLPVERAQVAHFADPFDGQTV